MSRQSKKDAQPRPRKIIPISNGEVVPLVNGYRKRKVAANFVELLEDEQDIAIICEDLKEILAKNGDRKDLHVEVSVWQEEGQ